MSTEIPKTKHTPETLRESTLFDFKGIFTISDFIDSPFKPLVFKVGLGVWLVFVTVVLCLELPLYAMIVEITSLIISIIPDILGFTIGGYSFLIGFIQPSFMNKISEPRSNSVFSLFQVVSASFACNIILQALALVVAFIIHFIIWIDEKGKVATKISYTTSFGINLIGFLAISFSLMIALAVILQLVLNVFNFSQIHHFNVNKEKVDLKNRPRPNNGNTQ